MGSFDGFNKILKMTLAKSIILVFLCVLSWSCQNPNDDSSNPETKKEDVKEKKIDLQNLDEETWKKMLELTYDTDSLLYLLTGKQLMEDTFYELSTFALDLDDDGVREIILEFKTEDENESESHFILAAKKKNKKYYISKPLVMERAITFNPYFDTINKILLFQSRTHGTCDDGYVWSGYKLKDSEWNNVLNMFGDHEGNSCGTFDEDDTELKDIEMYYSLHTSFKFISSDTVESISTVSKWKHDFNYDVKMADLIREIKIKLIYVYDKKKSSFFCYNSSGGLLKENESYGNSFWLNMLMEEGKL